MFIITKKAKLISPPTPPFTGTAVTIKTSADALDFGFFNLTLVDGHESIVIDWGDGAREAYTQNRNQPIHTYTSPGKYTIRLSDDIFQFQATGDYETGYAFAHFSELPVAFFSNAGNLDALMSFAFGGCRNLKSIDIGKSRISQLVEGTFKGCTGLSGELYLPTIRKFPRSASTTPFEGCTGGIVKIHFAARHENEIKSTAAYQNDPTLGTGSATAVFDL